MAAQTPSIPKGLKELEYRIVSEHWNIYTVDEGVVIRARTFLVKLLKGEAPDGKPTYSPTSAVVVDVRAPLKKKKTPAPDRPPNTDEIEAAKKTEVSIGSAPDEPWNEYQFDDGSKTYNLRIRLVVSGIQRVEGVFDQFGDPIYQVSHSTVIAPPVPSKVTLGR
jgi:hypothetical protein